MSKNRCIKLIEFQSLEITVGDKIMVSYHDSVLGFDYKTLFTAVEIQFEEEDNIFTIKSVRRQFLSTYIMDIQKA